MKKLIWTIFLVLTLVAWGCGDDSDDDGGNSTTDTTTTTDTSTTTDTNTTGGADTSGGTEEDTSGETASNYCTNESDTAYLTSTVGEGTGKDAANAAASECGQAALSQDADQQRQYTIDCMLNEKNIGLTEDCAGCYGDIVLCTIEHCISQCISDSSSEACMTCQEESGCIAAFENCSGLQ